MCSTHNHTVYPLRHALFTLICLRLLLNVHTVPIQAGQPTLATPHPLPTINIGSNLICQWLLHCQPYIVQTQTAIKNPKHPLPQTQASCGSP